MDEVVQEDIKSFAVLKGSCIKYIAKHNEKIHVAQITKNEQHKVS